MKFCFRFLIFAWGIGAGTLLPLSGRGQGMVDGFMKGAGQTTVALSYSFESFDQYYQGDWLRTNPNLGTIATRSLSVFATGGLTPYLDVVAMVPYIRTSASQGFWSPQRGMQDAAFYLKLRPLHRQLGNAGTLSALVAGGVGVPVSDYVPDAPVAIGHGSTNFDGRLVAHYQSPFGVFATVQGGYIRRTNVRLDRGYQVTPPGESDNPYRIGPNGEVQVPDALDWSAKIGAAAAKFYADAWINRQRAQSGTTIAPGVPFPTNAISYTRAGFNLYYPLPFVKNVGLSGGMGFTLSGENIGKATRYSGGLVYGLPGWGGLGGH